MNEPIRSHTSKNRLRAFLDGHGIPVDRFCRETGLPLERVQRVYDDERTMPDLTVPEAIWRAYRQGSPGSIAGLVAYEPEAPGAPARAMLSQPGPEGPLQVTICGCGNLGHVFAGLLSARPDLRVRVCVSTPEKADRLLQGMAVRGGIAVRSRDGEVVGRPERVTAEAAEAVPGSRLVLLCVPSFVEETVLRKILPFLEADAFVGSVPAPGGFDWKARQVFSQADREPVVFGVGVIPWMCKVARYGEEVTVLGKKTLNGVAVLQPDRTEEVANLLSHLIEMPVLDLQTFLNLSLNPGNQLLHPGILYDMFGAWDGTPLAEPPLFYESVTESAASLLQAMSDEVLQLRGALESRLGLPLSAVLPLNLSIQYAYGADVQDPTSLLSTISTNRAYAGLRTPMRQVEGGWAPDPGSRFFHEDIPHGLVVLRGIADLAGVALPTIDRVLTWAQAQMGREYLLDGALQGKDLPESGAPQRFGFRKLEDLVGNPLPG